MCERFSWSNASKWVFNCLETRMKVVLFENSLNVLASDIDFKTSAIIKCFSLIFFFFFNSHKYKKDKYTYSLPYLLL